MAGGLAHGADDLVVAGVADQEDVIAQLDEAVDFEMHLGDERARRVDQAEAARFGFPEDGRGDAVGAEDGDAPGGHFGEFLDEDGPFVAQVPDDVAVVDNLASDVDRRAEDLQRKVHDLDGAIDAGAKAAGIGEKDVHGFQEQWKYMRGWG